MTADGVRAIVFDFDGLIVETETPHFVCWQELYAEHGAELDFDIYCAAIGTRDVFDPVAHLESLVPGPVDRATLVTRHKTRFRDIVARERARPAILGWLDEAAALGLSLAVASSSDRDWVMLNLERLRLVDRFAAVRCRQDVAAVKPAPDLYLAATSDLGVDPSEAVAIEDSPNGITAAQAAGMRCVAVPNDLTRRMPIGHADLVCDPPDGITLADVLARL